MSEDRIHPGIRRARRPQAVTPVPLTTPGRHVVKGVGRYTSRHYCPTCGRKHNACTCKERP